MEIFANVFQGLGQIIYVILAFYYNGFGAITC